MRTQLLHDDVDERSWRLPQVDPTGWLAPAVPVGPAGGSLSVGAGSDGRFEAPVAVPVAQPAVRLRRPRRTASARAARERELSRRRLRRHGRVVPVGPAGVGLGPAQGPRPVATVRRVAEAVGPVRTAGPAGNIGRWGRLSLTVLVAATMVLLAGRLLAGALGGGGTELVEVTVRPGDTLWSIASTTSPDRDPRAVIEDIRGLNDLSGDLVRVGEVLRVPASAG
jgi:hypothetical protein